MSSVSYRGDPLDYSSILVEQAGCLALLRRPATREIETEVLEHVDLRVPSLHAQSEKDGEKCQVPKIRALSYLLELSVNSDNTSSDARGGP